jgi:hypothetical protein
LKQICVRKREKIRGFRWRARKEKGKKAREDKEAKKGKKEMLERKLKERYSEKKGRKRSGKAGWWKVT